mmetsp:Transcript_34819/g.42014  ORF Transcript_34819/g.42014 Transcript_34819/m.42014 type:complete len:96 (-) Transcript_34819:21-308(-)
MDPKAQSLPLRAQEPPRYCVVFLQYNSDTTTSLTDFEPTLFVEHFFVKGLDVEAIRCSLTHHPQLEGLRPESDAHTVASDRLWNRQEDFNEQAVI